MTSTTAWAERTVATDAPALFDKAASLPSCRIRVMDGFSCSLDLTDLMPLYYLDPGQPRTWDQPYIPPTVSIVRIESPKMPGQNLLPLFDEDSLRNFCNDILMAED